MSALHIKHINDFLDTSGITERIKDDFCIIRFDSSDIDLYKSMLNYTHDFFEISLTIGYKGLMTKEETVVDEVEYNVSFVTPGQSVNREWDNIKYTDTVRYTILFRSEFIPFVEDTFNLFQMFPYFNNTILSSYKLNANLKSVFKQSFDELYSEFQLGENANVDILKSFLTILLFKAKRTLTVNSEVSYLRTRRQEITYDFETLIKQTKKKHKPLSYYADKMNISVIYLSECIKKVTAKTAKQIIDEYLILEAKSLLKKSHHTIFEIASRLGFEDDSNFVKYFKKQTGLTPKQFKIYA